MVEEVRINQQISITEKIILINRLYASNTNKNNYKLNEQKVFCALSQKDKQIYKHPPQK